MANKRPLSSEEIEKIKLQKADLQKQIQEIQSYIEHAPDKIKQAQEESFQTMPAPDEISERRREKEFFDRLSRGELKNERRHQAKNGVLLVLLIFAIAMVSLWIYRQLQGN